MTIGEGHTYWGGEGPIDESGKAHAARASHSRESSYRTLEFSLCSQLYSYSCTVDVVMWWFSCSRYALDETRLVICV